MDILDRLLGHDAWTGRLLLVRCQELTDDALDHTFDAGLGSVRGTVQHTIGNVETWTALMAGGPLPARRDADAPPPSMAALLVRHDAAMAAFRDLAVGLARAGRLDERWVDPLDDPPAEKTYGGAIAHVLTHNHFHRAELLHMLARLGLTDLPEGDVLSWEKAQRDADQPAARDG